jgi:hypothetical protein
MLRVFFRHCRGLQGEVRRLVYCMVQRFFNAAAGRRIRSAALIACASAWDWWSVGVPAPTPTNRPDRSGNSLTAHHTT